MLCVLCLFVLWGFSLVTSYSGVKRFVPSYFEYNSELARNDCTVSGLFVAAAMNCETMSRGLSMQVQWCPT